VPRAVGDGDEPTPAAPAARWRVREPAGAPIAARDGRTGRSPGTARAARAGRGLPAARALEGCARRAAAARLSARQPIARLPAAARRVGLRADLVARAARRLPAGGRAAALAPPLRAPPPPAPV